MQLRQAVAAHKAPVHTTASPARPQARHTVVTVPYASVYRCPEDVPKCVALTHETSTLVGARH